jgi:hypothetical protein
MNALAVASVDDAAMKLRDRHEAIIGFLAVGSLA